MAALRPEPGPYFDQLFTGSDDPWRYRTSWYERRKRALLLAALPRPSYRNAFEPGCANGELSAALALRCTRLLASDASAKAVDAARARLHAFTHVTVEQRALPEAWPDGRFDLLVMSEWAYYLDDLRLETLVHRAARALEPDGTLVVCHWRHATEDWVLPAQAVHAAFRARSGLHCLASHLEDDFLLDVYSPDRRSVAQREGIA